MATIIFDRSGGLLSIKVDASPAEFFSVEAYYRLLPTGVGAGFTVLKDNLILIEVADTDTVQNGATVLTGTAEQKIAGLGSVFLGVLSSSVTNRSILPSNVINQDVVADTLADVTGLLFPVTAGVTYSFKFFVTYTAAATTTGSRWTINGPAAPTILNYRSVYSLTAGTVTDNEGLNTYLLPAAANASSASTTSNIAIVEGIIKPSVTGSVQLQFASEVSASAITAVAGSSYIEYQQIN